MDSKILLVKSGGDALCSSISRCIINLFVVSGFVTKLCLSGAPISCLAGAFRFLGNLGITMF